MKCSRATFLILLLGLLTAIFSPLVIGRTYAQAGRIYLEPGTLLLEGVGSTGTLEVRLSGASEISAFETRISYDISKIRVDGVEFAPALGGSKVGPNINGEAGWVSFGAWTMNRVDPNGGDFDFVNIIAGQESPVLLATISLTAVGEGNAAVSFVEDRTSVLGTEAGEGEEPPTVAVDSTDGLVQIGGPSGTEIVLRSGGNNVVWPAGLADFTSLSALGSIQADCGSAPAISRKKSGWWESAVYGYGGVGFALSEGSAVYIRVASSCVWTP